MLLDVGSARQVTLLGVLVGTAGFAASFLATGVAYLIVSFSALIGTWLQEFFWDGGVG